jgi:hypothetical protein
MCETTTPTRLEILQRLLQNQLRDRLRTVSVVQRGPQVVLRGIAISYYVKQLAQQLALSTLQKAALVNEIEVRYAADEEAP